MVIIPEEVVQAWEKKQKAVVLTTVSNDGIPNSIYATCAALFEGNKVLIANNLFQKTYNNILGCDKAAVLFISEDFKKAYQFKGCVSYKTEGKEFDDMKKWNPPHLEGRGVAILDVLEIYSGAEKLV